MSENKYIKLRRMNERIPLLLANLGSMYIQIGFECKQIKDEVKTWMEWYDAETKDEEQE